MGSIGGYSVMSIQGPPPSLSGTVLGDITRPGVPGKAFWPIGTAGTPFSVITTTACASVVSIGLAITSYSALKGNIVSIVDDLGNQYNNLVVREVRPVAQFWAGYGTNPAINWILQCEWTFEHIG